MKQGCLLLAPELASNCDVFDAIIDNFTLIRAIEVPNDHVFIFIVEHEDFFSAEIGDVLPFYDLEMKRGTEGLEVVSLAPYIHSKYFIQCQKQQEPPKQDQEENNNPLIWMP